jgi:lipid II:glycine glycyltransferase (peptidoglycan interpeptide bridge formation enzyme)
MLCIWLRGKKFGGGGKSKIIFNKINFGIMQEQIKKFIQDNSPDGGFLQSPEWQKFQESVGRKIFNISGNNFWANIIEHSLPIVGKYFYVPRGPIIKQEADIKEQIGKLINLSKDNNIGWIRIEPANEEILNAIRNNTNYRIVKAPHDMQPKELLMIDIKKSEEEILAQMKPKTRYNIKLAEKKGVKTRSAERTEQNEKYIDEFLRLVAVTAERNKITSHPENYYKKMFESIPSDILKLYIAEYKDKIIAANLVVFYGNTCIYLHGASDDEYRNVMAPYMLQWRQIRDAAEEYGIYDLGGIRTEEGNNNWKGITRFKTGFSPVTKPTEFPGSYDIIIDPMRYYLYIFIQKIKNIIK